MSMGGKKKSNSDMLIFFIAAIAVMIICTWGGYVLDMTSSPKHGVQLMKAVQHIGDYAVPSAFINAFATAFSANGITRKGMVIGFAGGLLVIMYKLSSSGKRYHRRGEEHGSAHWGTKHEKDIIADMNDFYNNAIAASDVLLVLDRKKRDFNAMPAKQRKKKEKEAAKEKQNEEKRLAALKAEAKRNSPSGNETGAFVTNGTTLERYCGNDTVVYIPESITKIGKFAFTGKNIKTVTAPAVKIIEKGAFFGCEKLDDVYLPQITSIGISAFENCYELARVEIGHAFKNADKTAFLCCAKTELYGQSEKLEKYAAENNLIYIDSVNSAAENEKISVAQVAAQRKTAAKIKPMLNLNMIILGGSGTGKSRFYVKPNIMQCNTSFVVTDPSGELLQSCGKMLERMGYKIKVFNINDMRHSSNYNPFHYLRDSTGEINSNNVIKMINVFMTNTKGEGNSSDPFWDDATRLLLSSLCFLLIETGTEEEQNFAGVLDLIHKAKVIEGKEEEKSELDLMFDKRKEAAPKALSVQYYEEFKQAAGKTMQSILISTTTKLQHFKLEDVRNLTFKDNIHLETMGDEKTALFIIIPSTDTTYNFLAAMMYTQLFDTLYDRAIRHFHGRLPVHVRFICDEFANIGKIPEFEKILATCRKFEISAVVILQNLSQLKRLYEKSWQELPGNCDTMIYLGGKDQFTNEYLSKELGKETIDQQSINQTKGKQGSSSYNNAILGRELATIDELSTMDNNDCIVMVRGLHPFLTAKFDIANHPRYNMLDEADSSRNTYYLEDNIFTEAETEYVDFTEFYDEDINDNTAPIDVQYINGTDGKPADIAEIMSDIPESIRDKFSEFTGVYTAA